jgi:hypothetical protein
VGFVHELGVLVLMRELMKRHNHAHSFYLTYERLLVDDLEEIEGVSWNGDAEDVCAGDKSKVNCNAQPGETKAYRIPANSSVSLKELVKVKKFFCVTVFDVGPAFMNLSKIPAGGSGPS